MDTHFKKLIPSLEKAVHMREDFLFGQEKLKEALGHPVSLPVKDLLEFLSFELSKVNFLFFFFLI